MWTFAFIAAIIPSVTFGAWGKYEVVKDQQVTEFITRMCTQNGAEDKVPQVLDAIENFEKCTVSLFKDEALLQEVATSIRSGDLDGVFKNYCARAPQLGACAHTLLRNLALCAGGAGAANTSAADAHVDQLLDFVCHNDGERIALFIKDGGPQCFQQNAAPLSKCSADLLSQDQYLYAVINMHCDAFDRVSSCVETALRGCRPAAAAELTHALFAQLRQGLPCAGDDDHAARQYMSWLQSRSTLN